MSEDVNPFNYDPRRSLLETIAELVVVCSADHAPRYVATFDLSLFDGTPEPLWHQILDDSLDLERYQRGGFSRPPRPRHEARTILDARGEPLSYERGMPARMLHAYMRGRLPGPEYREHFEMICKWCRRRARARAEDLWPIFDALTDAGVNRVSLRDLADVPALARRLGVSRNGRGRGNAVT